MGREPINPGIVDWSGDNPGMYLKESPDGPFVTVISFFRVVISPHGRGHAAFMLLDPHGDGTDPRRPNLCLTDNEPLAHYLKTDFVAHFGAFQGATGLDTIQFSPAWDFASGGDGRSMLSETFVSSIGETRLVWSGLSDPYMVELGSGQTPTGKHELFSLFADAGEVQAVIGGNAVVGRPATREFAGKKDSSTAFLALSETWVKV